MPEEVVENLSPTDQKRKKGLVDLDLTKWAKTFDFSIWKSVLYEVEESLGKFDEVRKGNILLK